MDRLDAMQLFVRLVGADSSANGVFRNLAIADESAPTERRNTKWGRAARGVVVPAE
jgi:hypothetical protein